jgi:hypothetical protein
MVVKVKVRVLLVTSHSSARTFTLTKKLKHMKVMQTIQETVASVQNAFPSIYTKDDVVKLLESIEIEPSEQVANGLTRDQIEELCKRVVALVKENAKNLDSDCIDRDSAEMSMGYSNTVELDSVEFDTREVANQVVNGIGDVIEEYFEELNKEDEVVMENLIKSNKTIS